MRRRGGEAARRRNGEAAKRRGGEAARQFSPRHFFFQNLLTGGKAASFFQDFLVGGGWQREKAGIDKLFIVLQWTY